MQPCSQEHVWSHVERGGVRSCSWSLACQVRRNLGASRWHHWIGIRKSEGKDEFEALPIAGPDSRFSIAPLHLYSRPSMSTIHWSEVWPYSFMLAVTLAPLPLPHTITNYFLLIHGRHSPSNRASPPYIGRTLVGHVVFSLRTRTNPPSPSPAPVLFTALLLLF